MKSKLTLFVLAAFVLACGPQFGNQARAQKMKSKAEMVKWGEYLVNVAGCGDCHTPKIYTPMGPVPDTTRLLSGHPASEKVAPVPQGMLAPDKWVAATNGHFTAWAGPWGVSFTRNLTPDMATGLGSWTEAVFIKALRTGKDMGEGRDILPPMPWQNFRNMSDNDLKAIFAYLRTLKPVENAVPDPISPTGETMPTLKKPK